MGNISKCAILIDGDHYYSNFEAENGRSPSGKDIHLLVKDLLGKVQGKSPPQVADVLLRTYFFATGPCKGSAEDPFGQKCDLAEMSENSEKEAFFQELTKADQIDLRRCELQFKGWEVLSTNPRLQIQAIWSRENLSMEMAMEMCWLAGKRVVDKLVLVSANPVLAVSAKQARREGTMVFLHAACEEPSEKLRKEVDCAW